MRIYIASLADYNAGHLHGTWFDLDNYTTSDELLYDIQTAVLDTSPEARTTGLPSEEWAIHDYEAFCRDLFMTDYSFYDGHVFRTC